MSGGGGKGGSDTVETETKLPDWVTDVAKSNLQRADDISRIGYVPNYLPQVAAFSPMQEKAFANTADAAGAFGMQGSGTTGAKYLPESKTYDNGVQGYSTWGLAKQGIDKLEKKRPGQYEAITGMFIDPKKGTGGTLADNPLVASNDPTAGMNRNDKAAYQMQNGGLVLSGDGTGAFQKVTAKDQQGADFYAPLFAGK